MVISRSYSLLALSSLVILMAFVPAKKRVQPSLKTVTNKNFTATKKSEENNYYIIIDKSDYELKVYDEEGWYATYPIVFGSKDLGDKMKEGDKKTPDGHFKVIQKKIHTKWSYELLLDYPNEANIQRFNDRKQQGMLPKNAKIGSGIAIHATRPQEEWTVDNFYNWTDGCVSVKYSEMKDLYSYIPVGTPVTIQP
ncbi:MAG: L,D-transpeptidase [Aquabacterium sp.]|nr:L,D-transpeptidase [Ferruginibacter sp.]